MGSLFRGRVPTPTPQESKDVTIEIKWGLGSITSQDLSFHRKTIKVYYVVINGHTLFSDTNEEVAKAWAYDWMKKNPVKRHHVR
jgi:hypothetical protein